MKCVDRHNKQVGEEHTESILSVVRIHVAMYPILLLWTRYRHSRVSGSVSALCPERAASESLYVRLTNVESTLYLFDMAVHVEDV